jgi:protein TonB
VQAARLLSGVPPHYPPLAKDARVQGIVRLDAVIGADGRIENLKVVSGPPLLVSAAVDAVEKWTYQPTYLNGKAVQIATEIDVRFNLGSA